MRMTCFFRSTVAWLGAFIGVTCFGAATASGETGFVSLFDGRTLDGWRAAGQKGEGYIPKNGVLVCPATGGGNLFTEKEYENFIFRFEFKLTENANNGIGIRAPFEGDAAYQGMEIQVLHDDGPQYKSLRPEQYHGSVYDVIAARRGAQKALGEWNSEEIIADHRHIKVTLNGKVIVDANLNDVRDAAKLAKHPGLLRARGHIGFLGHGTHVEFRRIRVKELPSAKADNSAPPGFVSLFNGRDLTGWKGLVDDPIQRAKLSASELAGKQVKADELMRANWKVIDGALAYTGKGYDNLCSRFDYADFELQLDWKLEPKADSGIYLRGAPQVQIWEPNTGGNPKHEGSGGLYNNKNSATGPAKFADRPVGEWNHFRIVMIGDKVTVALNEELVAQNIALENYWDRARPIFPAGPIELQAHNSVVYFKNIYVREITRR